MSGFTRIEDSKGLVDVPGFQVSATACDIRNLKNDRLDLAMLFSPSPCSAAAVFTKNAMAAAPVQVSRDVLALKGPCHGIIANSGNANAATGEQGLRDAAKMKQLAAEACRVDADSFFVCSTGRIGRALPMQTIESGIGRCAENLSDSADAGIAVADAILTSDTCNKRVSVELRTEAGQTVTIAGIAKGAGMIEPNMATMFAFLTTDVAIEQESLQILLKAAVDDSFNAITIDGDMSTNDTVIVLANGDSGVDFSEADDAFQVDFADALTDVCMELAEKMVADGEKISKVVEIHIEDAETREEAEAVARAIGNSLLVKSSWFGNDPNWGRLLDAAGYAGVPFMQDKIRLHYARPGGDLVPVFEANQVSQDNLSQWKAIVAEKRFAIHLSLARGNAYYRLLSTDLTEGYVNFNKSE